MSKGRRGKKMTLPLTSNSSRKTRILTRTKNRLASMTSNDWKESNEVTKRDRGLSKLSPKDIYEEDKH